MAAITPTKRSPLVRQERRAAALLLLPFLLFFVALFVVPLVYSGWLSTFRSQIVGGRVFAGLTNYVRAYHDPLFWGGVKRVSLFLVIWVPVVLTIALVFALLYDSGRVRGARVARLVMFLPFAVPGVIATLLWSYIYGHDFGLISQLFRAVGLGAPDLVSSKTILWSIMNIVGWEFMGYNMIVLYAALRTVPAELYEAAAIDGAGQWSIAWHIKVPAIRGSIALVTIFSVIGSFQLFNEPQLMYFLSPSAIGTSFTPNLYAYNVAFQNQDVTYAAALAFALGLVTIIPALAVLRIFNRSKQEG